MLIISHVNMTKWVCLCILVIGYITCNQTNFVYILSCKQTVVYNECKSTVFVHELTVHKQSNKSCRTLSEHCFKRQIGHI